MGLNSLIGEVAAVERYSTLQNYPCVKVLKERKNKCFIERCIPILQGPSSCYLRKKKKFNSQDSNQISLQCELSYIPSGEIVESITLNVLSKSEGLSSVNSHMSLQAVMLGEWLYTYWATEIFHQCVLSNAFSVHLIPWMTWNIQDFLRCEFSYVASDWIAVRMTLNILNNWRVSLQYDISYVASGWRVVRMTWNILNNWKASLQCEMSYVASDSIAVRMTWNILNNWNASLRCEIVYAALDWITVRMTLNILNNWKVFLQSEFGNGFLAHKNQQMIYRTESSCTAFLLYELLHDPLGDLFCGRILCTKNSWLAGLSLHEFTPASSLFLNTKHGF